MSIEHAKQIMVSVCCLAYNHEAFIATTLDSLVSQKTSFAFEVICNDDASTDGTKEIIKEYVDRYPDIIRPIYHEVNQRQNGISNVWTHFYPNARGKYIAYCDGDDYWTSPNKLQRQVDFMERHPEYSLCLHGYTKLMERSGAKSNICYANTSCDIPIEEIIAWDKVPAIVTSLFRREDAVNRPSLFRGIGGDEGSLLTVSDSPLFLYLALLGKVRYLNENMAVYRRHSNAWCFSGKSSAQSRFKEDEIDFLERFDTYTNGQYGDSISTRIWTLRAAAAAKIGDYATADQIAKEHHVSLSSRRKILNHFGTFAPGLAKRIERNWIKRI